VRECTYVVLSNPAPGREEEYNRWYSDRHLAEVVSVPGFVSARRFKVVDPSAEGAPQQSYMALYNIKSDDPEGLIDSLRELVESGRMEMSEALSQDILVTVLYEAISPVVTA
jgi:hypothetical protein